MRSVYIFSTATVAAIEESLGQADRRAENDWAVDGCLYVRIQIADVFVDGFEDVKEWVAGQLGSEAVRVDVDVSGSVDGRTEVLSLVGRLSGLAPAVVFDDRSERSGWTSAEIAADATVDGRRLFVSPSHDDHA